MQGYLVREKLELLEHELEYEPYRREEVLRVVESPEATNRRWVNAFRDRDSFDAFAADGGGNRKRSRPRDASQVPSRLFWLSAPWLSAPWLARDRRGPVDQYVRSHCSQARCPERPFAPSGFRVRWLTWKFTLFRWPFMK